MPKLTEAELQEAIRKFKPVYDAGNEIDPWEELDWYALTLGYFLGLGEPPKRARAIARHLRYNTELG